MAQSIEQALERLTREARAGYAALGMDPDAAMGTDWRSVPCENTFRAPQAEARTAPQIRHMTPARMAEREAVDRAARRRARGR